MINPFKPLLVPAYFFRPRQIATRLRRCFAQPPPESDCVRVPWGDTLHVHPNEVIGAHLWYYGVFDLLVTETIWRLLDSGETAVDIGANIGQMTSAMRHRVGASGKVIACEPHPGLFEELAANLRAPEDATPRATLELHALALSSSTGEAELDLGSTWSRNRGLGRISANPSADAQSVRVRLETLDHLLPNTARIGLCKVDVEGHEEQVFRGAAQLLEQRSIRDIIFEDFGPYPSPVHRLLQKKGFSLFALRAGFARPRLEPAAAPAAANHASGDNYLATLDSDRARERFQGWGWRCLRGN